MSVERGRGLEGAGQVRRTAPKRRPSERRPDGIEVLKFTDTVHYGRRNLSIVTSCLAVIGSHANSGFDMSGATCFSFLDWELRRVKALFLGPVPTSPELSAIGGIGWTAEVPWDGAE